MLSHKYLKPYLREGILELSNLSVESPGMHVDMIDKLSEELERDIAIVSVETLCRICLSLTRHWNSGIKY